MFFLNNWYKKKLNSTVISSILPSLGLKISGLHLSIPWSKGGADFTSTTESEAALYSSFKTLKIEKISN